MSVGIASNVSSNGNRTKREDCGSMALSSYGFRLLDPLGYIGVRGCTTSDVTSFGIACRI